MATLSERLVLLKEQHNLRQKDIAKNNNIALRTYQTYEHGDSEPTVSTIIKLAKYFDVTSDYLLGLTDNPEVNK